MLRLSAVGMLLALATHAQAFGRSGPQEADHGSPPAVTKSDSWGNRVLASYYGRGERLARHTSTGEVFNPYGLTAAHRTLPFGTLLQITYLDRVVVVRVNDRGPAAYTGRALDLSYGAALRLGLTRAGTGHVTMVVLN